MTLNCQSDPRRDAVRAAQGRNGLDYVEVIDGPPTKLYVYFLGKLPPELKTKSPALKQYLQLSGGERISGLAILDVDPQTGIDAEHDDFLVVTIDRIGDYSTYTLGLVDVAGIDPQYATAQFTFRIDCPTDLDCKRPCGCPPAVTEEPTIDYLAKDYASFRQLILDRMALLVPDWTERHVPDIGVTLVELLAYVGDGLSYYQDAVATEAYLGTARQRISVRRHARLIDYRLHEGCNARAWVQVAASGTAPSLLPAQIGFVTGANAALGMLPTIIDIDQLQGIPATAYEFFEPLVADPTQPLRWREAHNEIAIYTWGRRECCLLAGAVQAVLVDGWQAAEGDARTLDIRVGDVLVFEEVLGAHTGSAADADPARRWAVRVTDVKKTEDPLYPVTVSSSEIPLMRPTPLLEISWSSADALPFAFCISALGMAPDCRYLDRITVVRGNIVPVDHGRSVGPEPLDPVPEVDTQACCECDGHPADVVTQAGKYRPTLKGAPITFRDPADPSMLPASAALTQDPRRALPAIRLSDGGADWTAEQDLLASGSDDRGFVAEIDNAGVAHLRFGDGRLGRSPDVGSAFAASYRVGNGSAGNVGADAISHLVLRDLKLDGVSLRVRNPLPARGGIDPEPIAQAKLFAPHDFRDPAKIERAITAADYATLAMRNPSLQDAAARLAWTGSWYEADVSLDPLHSERADDALLAAVEGQLNRYRRMGHDLRVQPADYVPIVLALSVCAKPGYDRGHLKAALLARFSNRVNADGSTGFFHPDNLEFGQDLYLSRIIAAAQSVAGVQSVTVDEFHRLFELPNQEIANGVLPLAGNEIAQLDNDPDFPERGRLTIDVGGGR